jgi:hypothetical protein
MLLMEIIGNRKWGTWLLRPFHWEQHATYGDHWEQKMGNMITSLWGRPFLLVLHGWVHHLLDFAWVLLWIFRV